MQYIWHSNVININIRILWDATSELFSFRRTLRLWLLCTLKMDTAGSPDTVTPIYQTIWHHISGDCFSVFHWLYIPGWGLTSSSGYTTVKFLTRWGCQPHVQTPIWVSLLVWVITFDISGMGGPTSSNATVSIALRVIWPCKPYHYIKVGIPQGTGSWISIIWYIQNPTTVDVSLVTAK